MGNLPSETRGHILSPKWFTVVLCTRLKVRLLPDRSRRSRQTKDSLRVPTWILGIQQNASRCNERPQHIPKINGMVHGGYALERRFSFP